jgi:hypothetical protein
MFAVRDQKAIALTGVDHVISLTAVAHAGGAAPSPSSPAGGVAVHWRTYFMELRKGGPEDASAAVAEAVGGGRVPRVELQLMGPCMDLLVRRAHFASTDLEKAAMRQPRGCVGRAWMGGPRASWAHAIHPDRSPPVHSPHPTPTPTPTPTPPPRPRCRLEGKKKGKNVTTNAFGDTLGRLHMERQDFDKLAMRKGRAAQADRKRRSRGEDSDGEGGGGGGGGDDDGEGEGGAGSDDGSDGGDAPAPAAAPAARGKPAAEAAGGAGVRLPQEGGGKSAKRQRVATEYDA